MQSKNTSVNLQILTPNGFQPFDGVSRYFHTNFIEFSFLKNKPLRTALDHRFIVNGEEVFARDIKINDDIGDIVLNCVLIENEGEWFYDPMNVREGSIFYHDDNLISHNSFHGSGNTLINAGALLKLKSKQPLYAMNNAKVYDVPVKASKDENTGVENKDHQYMMFVDVARGRGQDYSTFNMIDITARPFKQVATFRDNMISPLLYPDVLKKYAVLYNNAIVVIENNDQGTVVCNGLYYDLEYENTYVSSSVKSDGIGVFMDKRVKKIGCSNIKDLVEQNKIDIVDAETIVEMSTFIAKGQSYEAASHSHDDLMMNLVLFGWFSATPMFTEMLDSNMRQFIYAQQAKQIEDEVLPFGFIEDGRVETTLVDDDGQVWEFDFGDKDKQKEKEAY